MVQPSSRPLSATRVGRERVYRGGLVTLGTDTLAAGSFEVAGRVSVYAQMSLLLTRLFSY